MGAPTAARQAMPKKAVRIIAQELSKNSPAFCERRTRREGCKRAMGEDGRVWLVIAVFWSFPLNRFLSLSRSGVSLSRLFCILSYQNVWRFSWYETHLEKADLREAHPQDAHCRGM